MPSDMPKLRPFLFLFALMFLFACATSKKTGPSLRFHVQTVEEIGKENIIPVHLNNPRSTIFIPRRAALNEGDVTMLRPLSDGRVEVIFNEVGKVKLETVTKSSIGLIMIVLAGKRVIYSPVIDVAISTGRLILPPGLSPKEVDVLNQIAQGQYQPEKEDKFFLEEIFE